MPSCDRRLRGDVIDLPALEALEHNGHLREDLGAGRFLSVWRRRTERGARVVYDVRVEEPQPDAPRHVPLREQGGAFTPARAIILVERWRRAWAAGGDRGTT